MSNNNRSSKSQHKHEDLVFFVRVQYRCNSSWQGTIQWLDGKQQVIFRSALELGNLINDAKQKRTDGHSDKRNKSWNEKEDAS